MINLPRFLKIKIRLVFIFGFLCVIILAGTIITNKLQNQSSCLDSEPQKLDGLDSAISTAIKAQSIGYGPGETSTEGHMLLDTEKKDNTVKVYSIASFGAFGFENGIFTKVSGSGGIPTVIIFSDDGAGKYALLEYIEPKDGAFYIDSVKKMFPEKLWSKALNAQIYYLDLAGQQEVQAAEYLKSIGRTAKVSADYVEKKLINIDVQASNKLFAELTKYDNFLNRCPYWIGTREQIENGERYIYETSQGKTDDGFDLITFRKTKADGIVLKELKFKIVGSDPIPVE